MRVTREDRRDEVARKRDLRRRRRDRGRQIYRQLRQTLHDARKTRLQDGRDALRMCGLHDGPDGAFAFEGLYG